MSPNMSPLSFRRSPARGRRAARPARGGGSAGPWIAHVAEHVALELQTLAGTRVTRGKTRSVKGKPGVYNVMFAYKDEEVGLLAGRTALELGRSRARVA